MTEIKKSPKQESFNELCKFADAVGLVVEIDKPFPEFDNLILNVVDKNNKVVEQVILNDISALDKNSAKVLNRLSRKKAA